MEIFFSMNKGADGNITRYDLLQTFKEYKFENITIYDVDMIFTFIDRDGSGLISFSEFLMCAVIPDKFLTMKKVISAFNDFDEDRGGSVSVEEIRKIVSPTRRVDDQTMRDILGLKSDEDLNVEITHTEFAEFIGRVFSRDKI